MLYEYMIGYLSLVILLLVILLWLQASQIRNMIAMISIYKEKSKHTPLYPIIKTSGCYACADPKTAVECTINEQILKIPVTVSLCSACEFSLKNNVSIRVLYFKNGDDMDHWSKHYSSHEAHDLHISVLKGKQPTLRLIKENNDE
jgi:hypothetical protein